MNGNSIANPNRSRRDSRKSRLPIRILVGMCVAMLIGSALFMGCGKQSVSTPLDNAKQLLFQKKYDGALAECDKLLVEEPDFYEARVLRAEINEKASREDSDKANAAELQSKAIADLTKAIEAHPMKPDAYYWRYTIYKMQAEATTDVDAKEELTTLWGEDYSNYKKFEPSSALTYANSPPPEMTKALQTPMPLIPEDLLPDPLAELEPGKKSSDEFGDDGKNGEAFEDADDQEGDRIDDTAGNDSPAEDADGGEDTERALIAKDLASNQTEDDLTLQHEDPEPEQLSLEPPPQIIRNDLGAFRPLQFQIDPLDAEPNDRGDSPHGQGAVTTGITQQPEPGQEPAAWNQPNYRTSPFMQPSGTFGQASGNRSTGFNGSPRSTVPSGIGGLVTGFGGQTSAVPAPSQSRYVRGPTGFLPPSAQGQSQINPWSAGGGTARDSGEDAPRLPLYGNTPRPLITTAIPGSTRFQGEAGQKPALNQFGPNYTPIGQRPASSTALPYLPPQQ